MSNPVFGAHMRRPFPHFAIEERDAWVLWRLRPEDGTNRLTRACVPAVTGAILELAQKARPVIITGNEKVFPAGADLSVDQSDDGRGHQGQRHQAAKFALARSAGIP